MRVETPKNNTRMMRVMRRSAGVCHQAGFDDVLDQQEPELGPRIMRPGEILSLAEGVLEALPTTLIFASQTEGND